MRIAMAAMLALATNLALAASPASAPTPASAPSQTSAPRAAVSERDTNPFRIPYVCAGRKTLTVDYPSYKQAQRKPIQLKWRGRSYKLYPARSASGVRYTSRQLVWWSKGSTAFLTTRDGRMLARDCVEK